MKNLIALVLLTALVGCDKDHAATSTPQPQSSAPKAAAPEPPAPPRRPANTIVDVALGSKDHTTLVAALTAADYVESLDNAGPFTVFAPTNAAFDKLPPGTVAGLVKPEKRDDLRNILKYHVTVSIYQGKGLTDGLVLGMANGAKATVHVKDGKTKIGDATIIATVPASNGVVHVIDGVLLPPAK